MLKLPGMNKIQNLTKFNFLPLFYCSTILTLKVLLKYEEKDPFSSIEDI